MDIEERLYQYAVPKKYTGQTPNAQYKVDSEWHKYYSVDEHKNYFIENELEFLRQLKQDLIEYQMLVDQEIEKVKKREVKL